MIVAHVGGHGKGFPDLSYPGLFRVCVECLIGKQKKPILFKVTEPSHGNKRTHLQGGVKTRWQIPELWFMMTQTKS